MKKAITTGLVTGIVFDIVFGVLAMVRPLLARLAQTTVIALLAIALICVALALWVAMQQFSKVEKLKWKYLVITGLSASVTAAFVFGAGSFIYARYISTDYLNTLLTSSQRLWISQTGWFKSPLQFAITNFQALGGLLAVISLIVTSIYYWKNRNRHSFFFHHNHELIL